MFASRGFRLASLFACIVVAFSMVSVDQAFARKGGSFGSRGTKTFQSAPTTNTAPNQAAPMQQTMTPRPAANQGAAGNPGATTQAPGGFMNGFGGAMLRGVMLGGLLGLLFGGGFGGLAGMFGLLLQVALIGGAIYLVMRMMKARNATQPAMAGAGGGMHRSSGEGPSGNPLGGLSGLAAGLGGSQQNAKPRSAADSNDLGIGHEDLEVFQQMLTDVQAAFADENYAALRALSTPEIVSYLSEELAANATRGVRNVVSDVTLLQGDLAESWREGNTEYATAAMRYSAIDYYRDRNTGEVVEGHPEIAQESTELWTFVRQRGGQWQLSAIQEA